MLKTFIDYQIFEDFVSTQPMQFPIGSVAENEAWNTFWTFLKSGSDVTITNYNDNYKKQKNIFLTQLTTGRKGTPKPKFEKFNKPHNCTFPKKQDMGSVLLINESAQSEKDKYRENNGYLIGFTDNYKEIWKELAIIEKPRLLPVRRNAKLNFNSWDQLADYILCFTDLIIADNYMFDESLWEYNLFRILEEFSQKTPVKFNLLLLSYAKDKELPDIKSLYEEVHTNLKKKGIHCNLSIALASQTLREHDRGIFSNYMRIKSGDSFMYFNKNGDFITRGTDIDFHSLAFWDNVNASNAALQNIKDIIENLSNSLVKEKRLIGKLKNRLLNY